MGGNLRADARPLDTRGRAEQSAAVHPALSRWKQLALRSGDVVQQARVERVAAQLRGVAEQDQLVPGARQRYVEAPLVAQQVAKLARSTHQREQHGRALAALEAVDRIH